MSKRTQRISVRTRDGLREIDAYVFGTWAVHRDLLWSTQWAITQVQSGLKFPHSHTQDLSKAEAFQVAKALDREVGARAFNKRLGKKAVKVLWAALGLKQGATP